MSTQVVQRYTTDWKEGAVAAADGEFVLYTDYAALLADREEMLQLLANAMSDAEGWSAKDEDRAKQIVDSHFAPNGGAVKP